MAEIDGFAASLLEESKRFLERANEADSNQDSIGREAFLHATIMLAFCGLEAHVNAVADEMSLTKGLSVHDKAILQEKDVKLEDGRFRLKNSLKIYRLEDRMLFMHARFSSQPLNKSTWLPSLQVASKLRNQLTHPKSVSAVTILSAQAVVMAVVDAIDALYMAIYKKPFPSKVRGYQSKLSF